MEHASRLIRDYFHCVSGQLCLGGATIRELADHYGTPFFVYDRRVAEKKWAGLRDALPPRFSISYSVKANPNPAYLRLFLEKGSGLEVASAGEFYQALKAGCAPQQILFAGPGKTDSELEYVLSNDIGEIHAESFREIARIDTVSKKLNRRARVALRVNASADAEGGAMRMGGKPAPFGVDEEQMEEALSLILTYPSLEFRGIHLFTGTQILDARVLIAQYTKGLELARRSAAVLSRPLKRVDFGGGLGVPYFGHEKELDLAALKIGLVELLNKIKEDSLLDGTEFLVEPGRFLVAESGIYVSRVTDIKTSRGKKFLIVDGGMHHHLAASGNLGQTIKRNYPVAVLNKLDAPVADTVDIVGPLCTPLDVLARNIALPVADEGDLVGVFQSGAYARSASPLGFLSHATPPEIWIDHEHHYLIRRRGELADTLRDAVLLEPSEAKSS